MKIAIIGYSASGKSTLAAKLGERYQIPVQHLDCLQFVAGWNLRDRNEARAMAAEFLQQDSWVIDGNYENFYQKERLELADRIIFLNFNRFSCLYRAFRRYLRYRGRTREDMAEGCNEKIDWEFAWWILHESRTRKRREHFQEICEAYRGKVTVIRSQRELERV